MRTVDPYTSVESDHSHQPPIERTVIRAQRLVGSVVLDEVIARGPWREKLDQYDPPDATGYRKYSGQRIGKIVKRVALALLVTLTTLPALARWESCPSTCAPPTATATSLSRLPLYSTAKFSAEVRMSGNPMWAWTKTAPTTCTPAQLANKDDAFVCNAAVGAVVMRTVRVRDTSRAFTAERALMLDPEVPITRGTIRHCPMRLPDSSYSAEEREQCRVLDVLNGEVRGPDRR